MNEILIPSVIEPVNGTEQAINIINYDFLKKRTVYIGEVNDCSALSAVSQINYLASKSKAPIKPRRLCYCGTCDIRCNDGIAV